MSDIPEHFRVVNYDPLTMKQALRAYLAHIGVTDPASPFHTFWELVLDDHTIPLDALVLAFDQDNIVALGFATWRPYINNQTRLVSYFVDPGPDQKPVASALKRQMDAIFEEKGLTTQAALIFPEHRDQDDLYKSLGFIDWEEQGFYRMIWPGGPCEYQPVDGISLYHYDIATPDAKIEEELAVFYNRAYAVEKICCDMRGEDIRRLAQIERMWLVYARDDATGQIIAYSECANSGIFSGLAVLRPYWGKKVSELLVGYSIEQFRANGIEKLWNIVRKRNASSIRLQERLGWQKDGECKHFVTEIPQS
jgi:L-amino acid N-acyltransferase YncA